MSRNPRQLCYSEWMEPNGVLKISCLLPPPKKHLPGDIRSDRR